ncbi:hypothetical protein [Coxiella-like endosymbiont]|uniref:hypothetical protein n=1 Tax=Coxiella-like endosymbiont TaxID=1592897 RepID=UPI002868BB7A|nr:hypothetical protein [Coxiella-like endosymbiont]
MLSLLFGLYKTTRSSGGEAITDDIFLFLAVDSFIFLRAGLYFTLIDKIISIAI